MRSSSRDGRFVNCLAVGVCALVASTSSLASAQQADPDSPLGTPDPLAGAVPPPSPPPAKTPIDVNVGGGMILYYYQPLRDPDSGPADNFFEIFEARLRLDASFGRYRVHITPRIRDTPERGFFRGTTWVEEAYAAAVIEPVTIKLGKIYAQFGKFWDNSFYGNAQEYDGLKLDPNHGISVEGRLGAGEPLGLDFWLQYFVIDGTTNYALPNRDTHTIPGAHRRNQVIGRIAPVLTLSDDVKLTLAASGMYAQADIPSLGNEQDIVRLAADATFAAGGFAAWAEYSRQMGRHVIDFPAPGASSDDNHYLMLGAEYTRDWIAARYNFNYGNYSEVDYSELRHVPGVAATLNDHLMVMLELVFANAKRGGDSVLLDNSLNLTVHSNF